MLQRIIDNLAEGYMLLDNEDKRIMLSELKEEEERIVNVYWVIFIITLGVAGFCGWLLFIGRGQMYDVPFVTQKFIGALVAFPIIIFIEIAWVRSSVSTLPMIFLLATSVAATLASKLVLIYLVVFSVYFMRHEFKVIGMKVLPGYPAFQDAVDGGYSKDMSYEQMIAYDKKQREAKKTLVSDGEELEKLLKGELELDDYLGVVRYDKAEEMDEIAIPEDYCWEESNDTEKDRKIL